MSGWNVSLHVAPFRDEARQRVCLDVIHKIIARLTPGELQELLGAVMAFVSHPSPVCRERMYDILMWIQDNYRSDIRALFCFFVLLFMPEARIKMVRSCRKIDGTN